MIPAGKLKHVVELQSKTVVRDAMGGESITWTTQITRRAEIRHKSGRALIAAQQAQSEVTATITIRKASAGSLADDWRIVHGSDIYTLHAIITSDDNIDYMLECSKGLKNG